MLVPHRKFLDLCERLFLLVLHFGALTIDVANSFRKSALVLLGLFFRVDLWLLCSHTDLLI